MRRMIIFVVAGIIALTNGCIRRRSERSGEDDGYYCVCNANYCDEVPDAIRPLDPANYVLITSSKSGLFFDISNGVFENKKTNSLNQHGVGQTLLEMFLIIIQIFYNRKSVKPAPQGKITINQTDVYQEIFGFGGAVTDSAAINVHNLTHKTSNYLLRSYFGPRGINYNFIRTPMGGADFSTRPYTYAMVENDTSLHYFDLQTEDYLYKIPLIKRAQKLKNGEIKLITLPWSASLWMKTKKSWTHNSKLRPEYRQLWADYFVKYFEAYRRNGIEFWGVTCQNEPESYKYVPLSVNLNSMAWTAEEERDWIIEHLAPSLKKHGFEHIKIFSLDDNRPSLFNWSKTVFQDKRARDIIFGIALHFYMDYLTEPSVLDDVKELFPEKSFIYSESCTGVWTDKYPILGSWKRGESYATNIIENLSHWVSSWIDWNIALNMKGGPVWINNTVDSPIIVNSAADEFYKQPMFYVIGHFSKYIPPNSMRIGTTSENIEGIQSVAFSTPDGGVVLVILNLNDENKEILIEDPQKGTTKINVLKKSINTMKYW